MNEGNAKTPLCHCRVSEHGKRFAYRTHMSILPMLRAGEIIRALLKAGFNIVRQRGSHTFLRHRTNPNRFATVPQHSRDVARRDLASILRQSKLTVDEFLRLLK